MKLTPEKFEPITDDELRDLWKRYRDTDVRRLILEVHRARQIMSEAHSDALGAQYALWEREDGNVRSALQTVIDRLLAEKMRLGAMGGMPPKS